MKYLKQFRFLSFKNAILFFIIPIILVVTYNLTADNDIWFLLNHGKYIITNGFPWIEPFTIHQNFSFVMQQWLSATIFYEVFTYFSHYGLFFLSLLMCLYLLFITYHTCMVLSSNNRLVSIYGSVLTVTLLSRFLVSRPQLFSLSILMTELYVLEKYWSSKNRKYLWFLPILSFLLIQLHASIWFMLFLFFLPYFVEQVYLLVRRQKNDCFFFFGIILITFLVGFLNPYGVHAVFYLFSSYGIDIINRSVQEMMVPNITTLLGKTTYLTLFSVYFCYLFYRKQTITIRHFLLLIGTTYLLLSSYRGQSFFILASIPPLARYFKDSFSISESKRKKWGKTSYLYAVLMVLLFLSPVLMPLVKGQIVMKSPVEIPASYILEHDLLQARDLKIYTDYNSGGYLEYVGLRPYIDPRAEVFLKQNNHREDILQEYYDLERGKLSYQAFRDKYLFDYYIVRESDFLFPYLETDPSYQKIDLGEGLIYQLYQRNTEDSEK